MNQRIRELEKQCTTYHYGGLGTEFEYFDKEKFAKLIVQECIDIADEYDGVGITITEKIKKHFGVKE